MNPQLFQSFDDVRRAWGDSAAPEERKGKIRCRSCYEWIPPYAIDIAIHTRQETVRTSDVFDESVNEYQLLEQPPRETHGNE